MDTPQPGGFGLVSVDVTECIAMIRLAIHGAHGRMGQRLIALADADDALTVAARFDTDGPIVAEALADVDVVIDFSAAAALPSVLAAVTEAAVPLVLGTTGLSAEHEKELDAAIEHVAVLPASNFSLVVNVLHHLSAQAVQLLGDGWDLEIMEAHHRYKQDAPSGTALTLADTLADAAGRSRDHIQLARHGHDALRQPEDITVQSIRIGDHPGEHTVYLAAPGERLELRHVATSRDSYAAGALRAAKWLVQQPAGRYTMADVLGL